MKEPNKKNWITPNWQAYVVAGKTKEDRRSRLEEVPISLRDQVRRHVETYFGIKKYRKKEG